MHLYVTDQKKAISHSANCESFCLDYPFIINKNFNTIKELQTLNSSFGTAVILSCYAPSDRSLGDLVKAAYRVSNK